MLREDDHLLVFLRRNDCNTAGVAQRIDPDLIAQHIQLLHVISTRVGGTMQSQQPDKADAAHCCSDLLACRGNGRQNQGEVASCLSVLLLLRQNVPREGDGIRVAANKTATEG